jgi:hypothetical protein
MDHNIEKAVIQLKNIYKKFSSNISESDLLINKDTKFFKKNDWLIKKNFFEKKIVLQIKKELLKNVKYLNFYKPKDCSKINRNNYKNIFQFDNNDWLNFPKLSEEDYKKGINFWKNKTSYVVFKDVMKLAPSISKLANDKRIFDIIKSYNNNSSVKLVFAKVIYSFSNNLLPIDTQLFHSDYDGEKIVKVFVYLDPINKISEGPSQFIKNTNIFKVSSKLLKEWPIRLNDKTNNIFHKNKTKSFFGNTGDTMFLNTGMLHRGKKPKIKDRMVLILSYSIHDEVNSTAVLNVN